MAKKWICLDTKEVDLIITSLQKNDDKVESEKLVEKLQKNRKRILVSSAKSKGRNLQHFVCSEIADILQLPYNQQDDQCLIHSREMGQRGTDVVLRGEALQRFPFSVECKNQENLNLVETVEQAKANIVPNTDYLIVHTKKAIPEKLVIISWDTFKKLLKGKFNMT